MAKANTGSAEARTPPQRMGDRYKAGDHAAARRIALSITADAEASHEAKAAAEKVLHGTAVDARALQIGAACVALAAFVVGFFIL